MCVAGDVLDWWTGSGLSAATKDDGVANMPANDIATPPRTSASVKAGDGCGAGTRAARWTSGMATAGELPAEAAAGPPTGDGAKDAGPNERCTAGGPETGADDGSDDGAGDRGTDVDGADDRRTAEVVLGSCCRVGASSAGTDAGMITSSSASGSSRSDSSGELGRYDGTSTEKGSADVGLAELRLADVRLPGLGLVDVRLPGLGLADVTLVGTDWLAMGPAAADSLNALRDTDTGDGAAGTGLGAAAETGW